MLSVLTLHASRRPSGVVRVVAVPAYRVSGGHDPNTQLHRLLFYVALEYLGTHDDASRLALQLL